MNVAVVDPVERDELFHAESAAVDTGAALTVTRLTDVKQLEQIVGPWNRLAGEIPFRRWEWLEAWWRYFADSRDELFVLAVHDEQRCLVGLAPWFRRAVLGQGHVVRFLGSGEVCSDYLSILAEETSREAVVATIGHWLHVQGRHEWDALELQAIDAADPAANELAQLLMSAGHPIHRRRHLNCWRLELPVNWESYLATLSRTRRSMVRKLQRNCFDTGRAVVRCACTPEEFEQGWRILVDLHQRRRRTLGEYGCFATPRFEQFLKVAMRRLFDRGLVRLQWVELDGRPAVVEIDLIGGDTLYLYQSGIEPDLANERPGWLGTMATLRAGAEAGFGYYDFLRGDEPYKAHWRARAVPLVDLRIVAAHPLSQARHAFWLGLQSAKSVGKRVRNRWRHIPEISSGE